VRENLKTTMHVMFHMLKSEISLVNESCEPLYCEGMPKLQRPSGDHQLSCHATRSGDGICGDAHLKVYVSV
jgi:hypothetical protein